MLLRAKIASRESAEALVVTIEVEDVSLAGVPEMFEHKITEMVNKELVRKEIELTWAYARALTRSFRLPSSIAPIESLDLIVLAARVKIVSDGMSLAVRLGSTLKRLGSPAPPVL